jgi:hypothetical protein
MSNSPIRLNSSLLEAAEREASFQKRSIPKQIEYWADLGRAVEHAIDLVDVFAVLQGIKRLKLEDVESPVVGSEEVFNDLQNQIKQGRISDELTTAGFYFEASKRRPGLLDRVDTATGLRQTGRFKDGKFIAAIP